MPVVGHVGSDYERLRPEFKVIANPYAPAQRVLLVPPIRCDVALVHALAATPEGTLLLDPMEDDGLLALASSVVIASAERVVEPHVLARMGEGVVLPGIYTTGVVEVPYGAHPTRVRGAYDLDAAHLDEYVAAARDERRFEAYLARYVYGPADHAAYLDVCGVASPARP
jgi:glutaconate CoA-transferase subunit A